MDRDVTVGIVGAVVLVAAMVGIFFYERSVAPLPGEADGDAPAANLTTASASGSTGVGDSTVETLQLAGGNATFTLTWTPGDQSTDTMGLTVTPPGGTPVTLESSTSPLEVAAAGPAGNWTVEVVFVSAAGPAPGPASGVGADTTVSWSLEAAVRP